MEYLDSEMSGIIRYVKEIIGDKVQYLYKKIPENFKRPCIYFPVPEFRTRLSSTSYCNVSYMLLIKVFAPSTEEAYIYASKIALALAKDRYLIPVKYESDTKDNKNFFVQEPAISKTDSGVYTVEINWDSIKAYNKADVLKMQKHFENINHK